MKIWNHSTLVSQVVKSVPEYTCSQSSVESSLPASLGQHTAVAVTEDLSRSAAEQATQPEATVSRHSKSDPKNENIVFD